MWTFLFLMENNNRQEKKKQSATTTVMITSSEQNAIFQLTAFVWEVFRDNYLRNYWNYKRFSSKSETFPLFLQSPLRG